MASDFILLTDMIYNKGWSIKEVKHNFGQEIGWKSKIILSKDGQIQEIQSSAEDFVTFAVQIQKIVNAKGEGKLAKVQNTEKYWSDIEALVDMNGERTKNAIKLIQSGSFTFSFDPYKGIRKILQDKIPTNDADVRGVKDHFFETFAAVMMEAHKLLKINENPQKSNSVFAGYAVTYGKTLTRGFLGRANKTNVVDAYKKYVESVRVDRADLVRRIDEQEKYVAFLRQLLVNAGKVDLQNGARAVVDAYWRLCELCYPMLYVGLVAIAFAEDKVLDAKQPSFEDLVESLSKNAESKDLVECVEPILRNSEAHCATSIVLENRQPFVVAYDSRGDPAREIKRFPLSEVIDKLNCLAKSLLIALYLTLEMFECAFLLLVLGSYEFKMRLVTLDQY
jgi:hypothetical protein